MFSAQIARSALPAVLLATVLSACGGGGAGTGENSSDTLSAEAFQVASSEDTPYTDVLRGVSSGGVILTYSVTTPPGHGKVILNGGPSFTYVPDPEYSGTDAFTYRVDNGHGNSSAVVSVSVSAVNDPPTIDALDGPAATPPGSRVSLTLTSHDPDDPAPTLSVEQLAGTAITGLAIDGNHISFDTAASSVAQVVQLRVKATDAHGAAAVRDYSLGVFPVSASGRLHTVRGSMEQPGLHLVITGDGYTQNDQALLLADAQSVATVIADAPEVQAYAAAWNVHVLEAVSPESGVDIPREGISRNTLFNGQLGCADIDRLLCVDSYRVETAVAQEFPAYTSIIVLVNTDRSGGAGGEVAVISRRPEGRVVAFHEAGHSFAGLKDEYVDLTYPDDPLLAFSEESAPNVTRITDLAAVKWRHWFVDPVSVPHLDGEPGVGLFEGAMYSATGFYRPTYDSFMRNTSANMGPVNREAWIKAMYQRGGATRRVDPQASTLDTPAGQQVTLTAVPMFPAQQGLRWYENDNEIAAAANQASYQCCSTTAGVQTVTVRISDTSNLVRSPDPGATYFEKSWQITWLACACQAQDVKPFVDRVVLLTISVDAGTHRVQAAKVVDSSVPFAPGPARVASESLNYAVTDVEGHVLLEGGVQDPQIVRSPLPPPGEPAEGHKIVRLPQTQYLLRLPYRASMRYLQLEKGTKPARVSALQLQTSAGQRAANGSGTIDLAPWLPSADLAGLADDGRRRDR